MRLPLTSGLGRNDDSALKGTAVEVFHGKAKDSVRGHDRLVGSRHNWTGLLARLLRMALGKFLHFSVS